MLDLLITDALVVDGGGGPPFVASVGVADGRIAAIVRADAAKTHDDVAGPGAGPGVDAARVITAGRHVLAPGFIDVHTHSDLAPFTDPWMDSALRQGVTTAIVGNCGGSAWPKAGLEGLAAMFNTSAVDLGGGWDSQGEYLAAVDAARPACNVATLVGFGNLRTEVMGLEQRPASPSEVDEMRRLLRDALAAGALGLSTGLIYVPDMYAATGEIAAVAAELARHGGLYTSHMRAEGRLLFEAVKETLAIGRAAGAHPHVSHLKLEGSYAWGRTDELLALLDEGGATADQYPYTAWETDLSSFLPPWAPVEQLASLLAEPSVRARLVAAVQDGEEGWESSVSGAGWDRIVVESGSQDLAGLDIAAAAAARGVEPVDLALALLLEDPHASVSGHTMREEDVRAILAQPDILVASDGVAVSPEGPLADTLLHPRSYGTFTRVLGRYVRELGILDLEAAIRKMTALPAEVFGLRDRGVIAEGACADLVLFDPAAVGDLATFARPHAFATGVDVVVVGGRVAWDAAAESRTGEGHGERAGRALRRGHS